MSTFSLEEIESTIKITCASALDAAAADEFAGLAKSWMVRPAAHFVLDFHSTTEISRAFYRAVIQFKTVLRADQKSLYSVNLNAALLAQVKEDGVAQAFNPIKSVDRLLQAPARPAQKGPIDVEFLNPFLTAIEKTFAVQCNTKITIGKIAVKHDPNPGIAVAGVLSLISNGFSGSLVLCFTKPVFLKIYQNMFNETHVDITPEIEDAAGELLNIIYGMAKIELNQKGYEFQTALPTVLGGDKIVVRQSGVRPAVVIPVETGFGEFFVEIEFQTK